MIYLISPWGLWKQFANQFFEMSFIFNWVIVLQGLAQVGIDEIAADGTVHVLDPARLLKSSVK